VLAQYIITSRRIYSITQQRPNIKKGKEIPLKPWTGPEDSRKLRLPDFKIFGT
jgi:hypothetical protein